MKRTTERVDLGLQCLVYGRLRIPLLIKEATRSECLVVIPVIQICPLVGQRYRPSGTFYQEIENWIHLLPSTSLLLLYEKKEEHRVFNNHPLLFWTTSSVSKLSTNWIFWVRTKRVIKKRTSFCLCRKTSDLPVIYDLLGQRNRYNILIFPEPASHDHLWQTILNYLCQHLLVQNLRNGSFLQYWVLGSILFLQGFQILPTKIGWVAVPYYYWAPISYLVSWNWWFLLKTSWW